MSKCKECNQSLELVAGRRQKEFCSRKCRNAFHNRKLKGKRFKRVPIEEWEEMQAKLKGQVNKIAKEILGENVEVLGIDIGGRNNPLINAARGRDESGVNEDENRTELEFSKSEHKKAKSKVLNSVIPKVDEILVSATIGKPVTVKLNAESCVIPPMPERMIGEDSLDFAVRKNEWKKKYNK
jgi:endogenous inhibitor of DNA gyrase (YacG/DUF329 family)